MTGCLAQRTPQRTELDADALTMVRVRDGDTAALNLLFVKYRRRVMQQMYAVVGNSATAEELAQEVFLRVYRYRAGYEPTARFSTWLHQIGANLALNWLRDHKRRGSHESLDEVNGGGMARQLADGRPGVDERLVREAEVDRIRRAVRGLPARQRHVVWKHKFEGIGCEAIALEFGCSHQAVRSLLVRAYTKLRAQLDPGRPQ